MLKNEDIKQINKACTLLDIIWRYAIDLDTNDFYEKTKITTKDIHNCIKALNHIYSTETLKHTQANESANKWNKTHTRTQKQINNLRITYNKTCNKYQVTAPTGEILKRFNNINEATKWAKQQKNYIKGGE